MKKGQLLFVCLLIATIGFAQVQTQKGVSYRYNGKNPRTPLPNVTVECVTANNAVISDSTGSFTLTFNTLKMGDRMGLVTVKKREMMVFNQHAVDEWSIRKEPLCLILCDANEFELQKQNLIEIGKREAQKKYNRQKAELEQQLAAAQIDQLRYEAELDKAYEDLARLRQHLDEYADLFARIDQSEIDSTAQQAMDLFNQGQVDKAIRLFEQGNYLEKLKASNRAIQQADQLIEAAEQGKANAEKDREKQLQSLQAQIAAYKVQNEWEKAGALLKGLADEMSTYGSLFEYALFCQKQNDFNEAEIYYNKAILLIRQKAQKDPQIYERELAKLLCNIGILLFNARQFTKSETMLFESSDIFRRLAKSNPQAYEYDLTYTLNNLATLYYATQRHNESEDLFLEVLEINRRLARANPQAYEPNLANVLNNLALLYSHTRRYTESEAMSLEALEIYRRLAKANPQAYEPDMTIMLNNLAALYSNTRRYTESETLYLEALTIRKRLAAANPQAYEPNLANVLNDLALLYSKTRRYTESETLNLEALKIRKRLAQTNPRTYEPDLAQTLFNMGLLRFQQEQHLKAIADFEDCLTIYRRLAQNNLAYGDLYIRSFYWLGNLYSITEEHTKSYEINEEGLPLLKGWYLEDAKSNQEVYVNALGSQSFQCIFVGQYEKSERYAREALSIDSTQHWICTNLAVALLFQGKYAEAEAVYRQYKDELKDGFLQDLQDYEAAGVIPEERKADVEKIRKILNE